MKTKPKFIKVINVQHDEWFQANIKVGRITVAKVAILVHSTEYNCNTGQHTVKIKSQLIKKQKL